MRMRNDLQKLIDRDAEREAVMHVPHARVSPLRLRATAVAGVDRGVCVERRANGRRAAKGAPPQRHDQWN